MSDTCSTCWNFACFFLTYTSCSCGLEIIQRLEINDPIGAQSDYVINKFDNSSFLYLRVVGLQLKGTAVL